MKHRRAETDKRRRGEYHSEAARLREENHAEERKAHSERKRVRFRMAIRIETDDRLQQRSRELQHEGDEANLREIELKVLLQNRVNGRNQRLHHVVEQMAEAESREDLERWIHRWLVVSGSWSGFARSYDIKPLHEASLRDTQEPHHQPRTTDHEPLESQRW